MWDNETFINYLRQVILTTSSICQWSILQSGPNRSVFQMGGAVSFILA